MFFKRVSPILLYLLSLYINRIEKSIMKTNQSQNLTFLWWAQTIVKETQLPSTGRVTKLKMVCESLPSKRSTSLLLRFNLKKKIKRQLLNIISLIFRCFIRQYIDFDQIITSTIYLISIIDKTSKAHLKENCMNFKTKHTVHWNL